MTSKNAWLVAGVVALLAVGGLAFYANQKGGLFGNATSTPPVANVDNSTTPPPKQQPQAGRPIAVTSSSVASTESTAIVSGRVTPNGAFTSYWYEYGNTANLGSKTVNQMIGSGYIGITAPAYITGLVKDTTYYFRLVAENQFGRVSGVQYSFKTTIGNPPPQGSAPSVHSSTAGGITRTTVNLNGEVTPNGASTQYWFEYGPTSSLGNTTSLQSVGDGTSRVNASVSLSGLDPATTYYFRLNAQNQFGTVNGSILNFTTNGPPAPMAPVVSTRSANNISSTTATLRGTVDPNGAETTYWFEYSTDSLLGSVLLNTTAQKSAGAGLNNVSVEADVTGLSHDTNYYFRVVAQNSLGLVRGERLTFRTQN